jgi:hypothetical protein
MEIWKTTLEDDRYEVSNKGNVRSKQRMHPLVLKDTGNGYLVWQRRLNGKIKNQLVHRTVYRAFVEEIPEGYQINHINFERACNEVSNLQLTTVKENHQHSRSNGRFDIKDKLHSKWMKEQTKNGLHQFQNLTKEQRELGTKNWKAGYTKDRHGRYGIKGLDNPTFKYSVEQIKEARDLFNTGKSMNSIAKQLNIPYVQIYHFCKGNHKNIII